MLSHVHGRIISRATAALLGVFVHKLLTQPSAQYAACICPLTKQKKIVCAVLRHNRSPKTWEQHRANVRYTERKADTLAWSVSQHDMYGKSHIHLHDFLLYVYIGLQVCWHDSMARCC